MKTNTQIQITPIASGIAVRGPYSAQNNEAYKSVGGIYDRGGRRWILPDNEVSWQLLHDLYGAEGPIVLTEIEPTCFTISGSQWQLGGYVVARWDTRKGRIQIFDGVELIKGEWDQAKSASLGTPCLMAGDSVFQIQVRHDFAVTNWLEIVEELGEQKSKNPLAEFSDDDLKAELEDRGYKVERIIF